MAGETDKSCATGAQCLALLGEPAVETNWMDGAVAQGGAGSGLMGAQESFLAVVDWGVHGRWSGG